MSKHKRKVLLLGWDAADWKIIHPLVDSGQMPTLAKLIDKSVIGNIATLDPPLSPMLWTSIATGKTADKHGILGFMEPDPTTGKIRPVQCTSRKAKAVWNILNQKELKSHVVGWWPSHPAEPINGVCVSNFFSRVNDDYGKPWPFPAGAVHPPELESTFEKFRIHPGEITLNHVLPFVPTLDPKDISEENQVALSSIAKLIASGSSYHAAATWILENKEWDLCALYLDTIDHFCHGFMKFHPPKLEGVKQEHFDLFNDVVNSSYRFHDMMLERLLDLAGEDTTVIILSDHGFRSERLRLKRFPNDPVAPSLEHGPYGMLLMSGPGIKKDDRIYGSTLLDICPTLLHLFGLPVGKDMDGKVLVNAFEEEQQVKFIESWEKVAGNSGQHSGEVQEDPWAAQEAIKQLVELGYVEALGEDDQKNTEKVVNESKYYLSRVYMQTQRAALALPLLEETFAATGIVRYGLRLAKCLQVLGRFSESRTVINTLREKNKEDLPQLDFLEGTLFFSERKPRKALRMLNKAEEQGVLDSNLYVAIGNVFLSVGNWKEAELAFIKSLSLDSEDLRAHYGLGLSLLRQDRAEEAVDEFLHAIGLKYFSPQTHYHLGEALVRIGEFEKAVQAFSVAVHMAPGNKKARMWLMKILSEQLGRKEEAVKHEKFIAENIKGVITVVSGLPRSGTSMMMQMLKAGGMPVLTDDLRKNDENNPLGYLELEKVKKLGTDNTWLQEAVDKCVKVVAPLISNLPTEHHYRIIFMQRDMEEVLRSQQVMLGKKAELEKNAYPMQLATAFSKMLEKSNAWIQAQPNVECLYVNYKDIVENPQEEAENVAAFLDTELDVTAMSEAVKKELYRNKK